MEKLKRLEAMVTGWQKALLKLAAGLRGRGLTVFVAAAAEDEAERVRRSDAAISLGPEESSAFAAAVLHPPDPTQNLRAAAKRYHLRP